MLIARTPVRISFGGGGTDLPAYYERYGGAVLSAAIDKYFYTILSARTDGRIQVVSSDLRVVETWSDISRMSIDDSGSALEIPLAVLKDLGREVAIDLFLASDIPPGTGLGSSASVCVNVLQALAAYLNTRLSKQELSEKAFHIAARVLGKPVGKQDEYAAAFGGLNYITFSPDGSATVEPLPLETDLVAALQRRLMLFFTGATHDSWAILREQEAASARSEGPAVASLHHIRDLAAAMRAALLDGDLSGFGELLHDGWEHKKKLSGRISNPAIDRLYSLARRYGAAGGKITGAGGGGFLLLYCEEEHQPALREVFAAEGIEEMRFGFDTCGARVLVRDPFLDHEEHAAALAGAGEAARGRGGASHWP